MDKVMDSIPQEDNAWHFSSFRQYAKQYNELADLVMKAIPEAGGMLLVYDLDKLPNFANTIGMEQHGLFQDVHGRLSMLCALVDSKAQPNVTDVEADNLRTFLAASVRSAVGSNKPESETEVQDVIEVLLIGRGQRKGIDYDRETGRVKISGKESIPDFILRPMSAALEVKLIDSRGDRSRVVDEINADIAAYSTRYAHLIFLVYDLGQISNQEEFVRDFELKGNVKVLIVKH